MSDMPDRWSLILLRRCFDRLDRHRVARLMIRFVVVIRAKCKVVALMFVLFFFFLSFRFEVGGVVEKMNFNNVFTYFHVYFLFQNNSYDSWLDVIFNSLLYYTYGRLIFWYRCVRHEDATDGSKHDVRAPMQEEEKKNFSRSHERHAMLHATCTWPRDLRCNSTISLRRRIFSSSLSSWLHAAGRGTTRDRRLILSRVNRRDRFRVPARREAAARYWSRFFHVLHASVQLREIGRQRWWKWNRVDFLLFFWNYIFLL